MVLGKKKINELRELIKGQIEAANLESDEKIRIDDKELLDALMFDKRRDKKNYLYKVPAWTGEFLRHIDLSEVDFEDVKWYCSMRPEKFFDYRGTNINPTFSKSYEAKVYGDIRLHSVLLDDVDLSGETLEHSLDATLSSFARTGIKFNQKMPLSLVECNLEGLDLSAYCFDWDVSEVPHIIFNIDDDAEVSFKFGKVIGEEDSIEPLTIRNCTNIKDSGLHISLSQDAIETMSWFDKKELKRAIKEQALDGCYINDVLIDPERKTKKKEEAKKAYDAYCEKRLSEPLRSINTQIKAFQKVKK